MTSPQFVATRINLINRWNCSLSTSYTWHILSHYIRVRAIRDVFKA